MANVVIYCCTQSLTHYWLGRRGLLVGSRSLGPYSIMTWDFACCCSTQLQYSHAPWCELIQLSQHHRLNILRLWTKVKPPPLEFWYAIFFCYVMRSNNYTFSLIACFWAAWYAHKTSTGLAWAIFWPLETTVLMFAANKGSIDLTIPVGELLPNERWIHIAL